MARRSTTAQRTRLPAAERRKVILDAARHAFTENGFNGTRTRDIAERAGVTEAFLYRHFASKDEMYEVAVLDPLREATAKLRDDVRDIFRTARDRIEFVDRLNERCVAHFVEYAQMQTVALYSDVESGRELYGTSLKPLLDEMGEMIAERIGWTHSEIEATTVRRAVLGAQWAIGLDFQLRHRDIEIPDVARRLTRMFTAGVKNKPVRVPKEESG